MIDQKQSLRLYVIGDIHGRLDLLESLIAAIQSDYAERGGSAQTITLGDYVDRGPDSRGVIELLATNPFPTPYVALKGNHEEFVENFLVDPTVIQHWARLGGVETLASFGVRLGDPAVLDNAKTAAANLAEALTETHREFFRSLRLSYTVGSYFFCHAGVRPGVALDNQSKDDLLWIRDAFLNSRADFGKRVVHGHTPVSEPEILANRINIDTGAFATGRLTCIVLENGNYRFLTATPKDFRLPRQGFRRSVSPVDAQIGFRLKLKRQQLKISQAVVGAALGLTFQQIQKYEKGANTISPERLQTLAKMFGVPVSYFFEEDDANGAASGRELNGLFAFFETDEGMRLASAFTKIANPSVRRAIVHLVARIAAHEGRQE